MNVVFLDIDGVMNHRKHFTKSNKHFGQEFCPIAVDCLKRLLTETNSKIVLSSTWRKFFRGNHELREELFNHYELENYLVAKTPVIDDEIRGTEIQAYIDLVSKDPRSKVEKFVIIDDDDDMGHLMDRLVHCKDYTGFNEKRLQEALKLMGSGLARSATVPTESA